MSGSANSTAGLPGHGPSFGPSGKCHKSFICRKMFKRKKTRDIRFAIIVLALAYILDHRRAHHVPLCVAIARSYE